MGNTVLLNSMGYLTFSSAIDQITLAADINAACQQITGTTNGVLLLEGGEDIHPGLYKEENRYSSFNYWRDCREIRLIEAAITAGVPIFGICRGHQLLAAHQGGSLYQDIYCDAGAEHNMYHLVRCSGPLREYNGADLLEVNSYHHQAVNRIPEGARVLATALDGIVEALYYPELFAVTVQWHPEFVDDFELLNWALDLIGMQPTRWRSSERVARY